MIVKNESKIIERCIKSVYHLIDTWCIVDTGSTDGTQEIIKNLLKDKPGELLERPWINFGHNRNEALELAERWGEWTLLTDADMVLVDEGFDRKVLEYDVDAFDIIQDNHGVRYYNFRLLNAKKKWKCVGVTHEYYTTAAGNPSRARVDKLWFNDISDGGSKSDKFERDIKLLTQGLIDEPGNHRYMFYLAQSYRDTCQYDLAVEWYDKCAKTSTWDEEAWFAAYMAGWSMSCLPDYDLKEVSSRLLNSWMMRPWRAEPIFHLAMKYKEKQMWEQAYQLLKSCATMDYPSNDLLFVSAAIYEGASVDEFSVTAYWTKRYAESISACRQLIEKGYGKGDPRIRRNLWFAERALGLYSHDNLRLYLGEKRKEVKMQFINGKTINTPTLQES
jgi:glycosyltransferase involved in cell wall biosynthesis